MGPSCSNYVWWQNSSVDFRIGTPLSNNIQTDLYRSREFSDFCEWTKEKIRDMQLEITTLKRKVEDLECADGEYDD